jgi:KUP system potassium uptake protein
LSITNEDIPYVPKEDYVWIRDMGHGFWKITGHYGFKNSPTFKAASDCKLRSMSFRASGNDFFINRETLIAPTPAVAWRCGEAACLCGCRILS